MSTNSENIDNTEDLIDNEEQRLKFRQITRGYELDEVLNTYKVSHVIEDSEYSYAVSDHTTEQIPQFEQITHLLGEEIEISENEIKNQLKDKELETRFCETKNIGPLIMLPSFIIYYQYSNKLTDIQTNEWPVALVYGNIEHELETKDNCRQLMTDLNIHGNDGSIIMVKFDTKNMKLMDDLSIIQCAEDTVWISANNDAKAQVYGQTGNRFVFGTDTRLLIMGRLIIYDTIGDTTRVQYRGKHSVELDSHFTSFVICGSSPHNTVLIDTHCTYQIDGELCANISLNRKIIGNNLRKSMESNEQSENFEDITDKLSDMMDSEIEKLVEYTAI